MEQIVNILEDINYKIINQQVTIEDLKILILITFNEILSVNTADPIVKSYLTITLKHFIELENAHQALLEEQKNSEYQEEEILKKILSNKFLDDGGI